MSMHNLFVYGTLKKGFPLHYALSSASFVAEGHTVQPYPMVVASPRYAPMMFDEPGIGYQVRGELYRVDDATLATLDRLEAIGMPGNVRAVLDIVSADARACVSAWAYFKSRHLAAPIHTPYLHNYDDRRFTGPQTAP